MIGAASANASTAKGMPPMKLRPLLALTFLIGAMSPALAQSQDGCIRLPSRTALVIVIPPEGCGTQLMAERRGDAGPTIVYGTLPARVALAEGPSAGALSEPAVIPYTGTNVSIAIVSTKTVHAAPKTYRHYRPYVAAKRLPAGKPTIGTVSSLSPGKAQRLR